MKGLWCAVFLCLITASPSYGQEALPKSIQTDPSTVIPVKVYVAGADGVTAPELIPSKQLLSTKACKQKVKGKVRVAFIVDANGDPRNLYLLQAKGTDLDQLALLVVGRDKFKPGIREASPVAVSRSVDVKLESCYVEEEKSSGEKQQMLRLSSTPVQKFSDAQDIPGEVVLVPGIGSLQTNPYTATTIEKMGKGITAPRLIYSVEAKYTEEARQKSYEGVSVVELIVDAHGLPQDLHVTKTAGHGLDQMAIKAVDQYRFKPAMKNGAPVAMKIHIEVRFRLY